MIFIILKQQIFIKGVEKMETVWIAIKDGKVYGVTSDKETMLEMINSYIDDNTSILETNTTILTDDIRAEEWAITE